MRQIYQNKKAGKIVNFWPQLVLAIIIIFYFRNFLFSSKMIFGQDIIGLNYPVEQFTADAFKSGRLPAWNPYAASGYPFLAFSSVFYPLNIIFRFLPAYLAFNWTYFLHFLIAGLGMLYFLRQLKLSKSASFLGAFVFTFSGFFTTRMYAGHYMLVQALAWFPLVFIFTDLLAKTLLASKNKKQRLKLSSHPKKFLLTVQSIIGLAVSLSMVVLTGHPQPVLYLFYGLIVYLPAKLAVAVFREKKLLSPSTVKLFIALIISFILTAFLTSPLLIPSLEAVKASLRQGRIAYASAVSYSFSPKKLLLFLAPFYFGSYATNDYHGGSIFHEMTYYLGVIPFVLIFFASLVFIWSIIQELKKGSQQSTASSWAKNADWKLEIGNWKLIFPFLILSLYAFFIAFGSINPFYKLIYYYVPGFGSLRAPARALMVFTFSGAVLAAFGFQIVEKSLLEKIGNWKLEIGNWKFSLFNLIITGLLTATILDLSFFSPKFLVPADPKVYFQQDGLVKFLQKNTKDDFGRVWLLPNTLLSNRGSLFKFFDVQSDAPMTIDWYSQLIDAFKARDQNLNQASERAIIHINNGKLLSLLGVKYVVSKDGIGDSEDSRLVAEPKIRIFGDFDKRLPSVLEKNVSVYERYRYLPRVKLFGELKIVNNEAQAIKELTKESFDEFQTVIVEISKNPKNLNQLKSIKKCGSAETCQASAKIISYDLNKVIIETNSDVPQFLLFNDVYYPGWKTYVDGAETQIYKSNLTFRGVAAPKGKHQVRFEYNPYSLNFHN